jgi:hypothetical protein
MNRRKHIPLAIQLEVALRQLREVQSLAPVEWHLDHSPPLALRPMNDEGTDTVPPASDPRFLVWLPRAVHEAKTRGVAHGTSKLATRTEGDVTRIAKAKRLERKRLRETVDREQNKPPLILTRKLPSRPFPKGKRPLRGKP